MARIIRLSGAPSAEHLVRADARIAEGFASRMTTLGTNLYLAAITHLLFAIVELLKPITTAPKPTRARVAKKADAA
ncbi:hypothetical protein C5E10_05370 [Pseudoclavibacter sp. RFBG4]|uniref:hypothetical protein n=1 Tax=Pseudoclavibacter sp. RFBG4 TaxID=2080575 RepID=UPI000CE8B7E3|nr:hypothetical protein [Pseudoclavibacter sp. RFBG4]PPG35032.1 hypothetical protein C5E10_05370 [Pseudoclavibacter sp. RFBG4]